MTRAGRPMHACSQAPAIRVRRIGLGPLPLLACLSTSAGCLTIDGTYGLPPLYEVYDTPSTFGSGRGTETYWRPFFGYERTEPETARLRSVIPFVDFRWGPELEQYWVLPVFLYRSFQQPLSGPDVDWALFPIFFAGDDSEEGGYFAVLPLGGTLKGLLAKDEIDFILFPIYWKSRDRSRYSLHVIWPFYNTVWGGDWSGSRIWPFYGRYQSFSGEGLLRYDRRFVCWPFYIERNDEMNTNPTHMLFICPFYGERINARTENHTYLWPLLQTHYDRRYDRHTYLGYLLPFRVAPGQTDIWPFFGIKQLSRGTEVQGVVRRTYRHFLIWPLERYEWASDGMEESTRFWLLPLFWHFHYIDKNTLETEVESKVWPLLDYRRGEAEIRFDLFSPLWFRREEYDRYYSRWFSIFRYRWRPRIGGWEILYGAVMYRWQAQDEEAFSVLGGLLEIAIREERLRFRFLYIPLW